MSLISINSPTRLARRRIKWFKSLFNCVIFLLTQPQVANQQKNQENNKPMETTKRGKLNILNHATSILFSSLMVTKFVLFLFSRCSTVQQGDQTVAKYWVPRRRPKNRLQRNGHPRLRQPFVSFFETLKILSQKGGIHKC